MWGRVPAPPSTAGGLTIVADREGSGLAFSRGNAMSTLTVLVFAFTFLSGMTAGAWLTVIANRLRRSAEARR